MYLMIDCEKRREEKRRGRGEKRRREEEKDGLEIINYSLQIIDSGRPARLPYIQRSVPRDTRGLP